MSSSLIFQNERFAAGLLEQKEKEEDTKDISINLCPLSSYELIIHDLYFQSLIFYLLIFLYHMVFIMCPSCLSLILLLFIFTFHAFFISFINKTNTAIFDEGQTEYINSLLLTTFNLRILFESYIGAQQPINSIDINYCHHIIYYYLSLFHININH